MPGVRSGLVALVIVVSLAANAAAGAAAEPEPTLESVHELSEVSPDPAGTADARGGPRIVGGTPEPIANWPWQVAIADRPSVTPGNGYQRQFCGGTLVAPTIVITAAHCLHDGVSFTSASNYSVITGRTVLSSGEGQEINFASYFVLTNSGGVPLYQPAQDEDYDVAVVQLVSASSSETIKVAGPSERATWATGQPAFVTGWGDLASGVGAYPDDLRAGRVQIISDGFCASQASYGSDFHFQTMLCAGLPQGGVDTCQGDSGGPLVVPISGGGFRLVGDTSWGIGCAFAQYPGIYGRIADSAMGPAIRDGILAAAGVDVYGSGAQPLTVPETQITSAPGKLKKKPGRPLRARFEFTSTEPGSSFVCSLDNGPAVPCASPFEAVVKRGAHSFTVTATNFIGDSDQSPAAASFKVKRKRKRRH